MKWIAALVVALFSLAAFAAKDQSCENKAAFVKSVKAAKDRNLSKEEVEERITTVVKGHPELGINEDELPEMVLVVERVYAGDLDEVKFNFECVNREANTL